MLWGSSRSIPDTGVGAGNARVNKAYIIFLKEFPVQVGIINRRNLKEKPKNMLF